MDDPVFMSLESWQDAILLVELLKTATNGLVALLLNLLANFPNAGQATNCGRHLRLKLEEGLGGRLLLSGQFLSLLVQPR